MRSMLTLHYDLEQLKSEEKNKKNKIDIEMKLEVCEALNFILDMRKDYLISNFIAWFQKRGKKKEKYINNKTKFLEKINKSLPKILPPIARTGSI
mmetsp:Transcript_22216/g.19046  ORF Transcript_22216/g.19046 Transcript_22216/m.19046 type:complete len:95 (+) Transcript_22216:1262-1546(+)